MCCINIGCNRWARPLSPPAATGCTPVNGWHNSRARPSPTGRRCPEGADEGLQCRGERRNRTQAHNVRHGGPSSVALRAPPSPSGRRTLAPVSTSFRTSLVTRPKACGDQSAAKGWNPIAGRYTRSSSRRSGAEIGDGRAPASAKRGYAGVCSGAARPASGSIQPGVPGKGSHPAIDTRRYAAHTHLPGVLPSTFSRLREKAARNPCVFAESRSLRCSVEMNSCIDTVFCWQPYQPTPFGCDRPLSGLIEVPDCSPGAGVASCC
jgi:hypothetical protein